MLDAFQEELNQIYANYENKNFDFEECEKTLIKLKLAWDNSRIDMKNEGKESNAIEILTEDKKLSITRPKWYKNSKGQGCKIETNSKNINLKFKCIMDGKLNVFLRGMDFKLLNNRMPVLLNINKLVINNKTMFDDGKLIWHNKPYIYTDNQKNNNVINLNMEVERIFDYYPQLKIYLNDIHDENDLKTKIVTINTYINYEKILIQLNDVEKNIYKALSNL